MKEFWLVVCALLMTVLAVFLLQIKIGDQTVEQRSEAWIHNSAFVGALQEVADGAVVLYYRGADKVIGYMSEKFGFPYQGDDPKQPGKRQLNMQIERSKQYIQDKAGKARELIKESVEETPEESFEEDLPFQEE